MRRHMGLKAYKCEQCDKEFQKVRTLKSHMEATHYDESKGQPKYTCDVDGCGKIYTRKVIFLFQGEKNPFSIIFILMRDFSIFYRNLFVLTFN